MQLRFSVGALTSAYGHTLTQRLQDPIGTNGGNLEFPSLLVPYGVSECRHTQQRRSISPTNGQLLRKDPNLSTTPLLPCG